MQFGDFFFDGDKRVAYEAPVNFSFVLDGNGYRIYTPDTPPGAVTTQYDFQSEVWSRYVDYMDAIEWATRMITASGGAPRPDGSNATADFLLINGWHIVPANYDHVFLLIGNMSSDTGHPIVDVFGISRITARVVPMIQGADSIITYTTDNATGGLTEEQALILNMTKYQPKAVYINTELALNGDGSALNPFNNVADTIDFAEANNILEVYVYADATIDRNVKNFTVIGIGSPIIDCAGHNLQGTEFYGCSLVGLYTGQIKAQKSRLFDGFMLNGGFKECGLLGDLVCADNALITMVDCFSDIPGNDRPSISLAGGTPIAISIRRYGGGINIFGMDNAGDVCTLEIAQGKATVKSTCTLGYISVRGTAYFVDESNGATVEIAALINNNTIGTEVFTMVVP